VSWSQTIKVAEDGSISDEQLVEAALAARSSHVDDELRARRDIIIDAQLDHLRALAALLGRSEDRRGGFTFGGHVDGETVSATINVEIKQPNQKGAKKK
jgi:hypothetical protein